MVSVAKGERRVLFTLFKVKKVILEGAREPKSKISGLKQASCWLLACQDKALVVEMEVGYSG